MIIIIDFNFYQIVDCLENLKEKIQHVVPFLSIFIHSFIHFVLVVVLLSNYSHYDCKISMSHPFIGRHIVHFFIHRARVS